MSSRRSSPPCSAKRRNRWSNARSEATDQVHADDVIPPIKVGPLRIADLKGPDDLVIDNLEIHPGAIVGVAGLAGAGVEELFAVLFGTARPKVGPGDAAKRRSAAGEARPAP